MPNETLVQIYANNKVTTPVATTLFYLESPSPTTGLFHSAGISYQDLVNSFGSVVVSPASQLIMGITRLSVNPAIPGNPIAVGDNDPRVPTLTEAQALVGYGTLQPSSTNPYVLKDLFLSDLSGKLTNVLPSGEMFIGNGSNIATAQSITQDSSVTNAGVWTNTGLLANTLPSLTTGYLNWTGSTWAFTTPAITSALLTGFVVGANTPIVSTDTILQAFEVTQGQFNFITGLFGNANGLATLDSGGKVPIAQLPSTVMEYQGAWNAATNTPTLTDGTGLNGQVWRTSVAGTQTFGSITSLFNVGDLIIYNGTLGVWQHSPAADGVSSVFGRTGAVVALSGDYTTTLVTEGTNLYFTNARAISSTLTGFSAGSNTAITSADSILSALEKTQGQINAIDTSITNVITGTGTSGIVPMFTGTNTIGNTIMTAANVLTGTSTTSNFLNITGTLPITTTAKTIGVNFTITSAGSSAHSQQVLNIQLASGYTGSSLTSAIMAGNGAAGTGAGAWQPNGGQSNQGASFSTTGTGTGHNVGGVGIVLGSSTLNMGLIGSSVSATNSPALNIGVAGQALLATNNIGGYFTLSGSTPTISSSAALMADNGAISAPIFVGRNNGTEVFRVDTAGNIGILTSTPTSALSIGASSQFQVNSTGNIVSLNGVTTSFPSVNSTGYLFNNGSGTYTLVNSISPSSITLANGDVFIGNASNVAAAVSISQDASVTNTGVWTNTGLQGKAITLATGLLRYNGASWVSVSGTSVQFVKGDGSLDSNTYLTGNQTITLTGDVTGSGTTSIATTAAATIVKTVVLNTENVIFSTPVNFVTATNTATGSLALKSQTANTFLASPNGIAGTPTFRSILAADVPTLNQNTTGTAGNVTGIVAIVNGGTGQSTAPNAINALLPSQTGNTGFYLTTNGTVSSWASVSGLGMAIGGTVTGGTTGSVLFVDGGSALAQNNPQFFWDNVNFRLGIGTITPSRIFEASASDANTTITSVSNASIGITNTNTTNNTFTSLSFLTNDTSPTLILGSKIASVTTSHTIGAVSADLVFLNRNAGTIQEQMRLKSTGNFSIGSSTAASMFNVGTSNQFQVNNAGVVVSAAGITSSGTITFSGLSTAGIVHNSAAGVLSTSLISLTADVSGVLPIANGGTNNSGVYAAGGILFSNGTSLIVNQPNFDWDNTNLTLKLGGGSNITYATPTAVSVDKGGNFNTYFQDNIQNKDAGTNASTDYIVSADNATDTTNYGDFGINSSGNTAATFGGAGDVYLYAANGNLGIGTASAESIFFYVGGGAVANQVSKFDTTGNFYVFKNLANINGLAYTWPTSGLANNAVLQTTLGGALSWVTPFVANYTPANPTARSSTTAAMQGLGTTIVATPSKSGEIHITIDGNWSNVTSGDGVSMLLKYGTGTAPANGAAVSGTSVGATQQPVTDTSTGKGGLNGGAKVFSMTRVITGLTIGTTYWFDIALATLTGGSAVLTNLNASVWEH